MRFIDEFIQKESSGGIVLIGVTILALVLANSPLYSLYEAFLHVPLEIKVGTLKLSKSLYHWVNEGLMTVFFLLVGLEVKREVLEGHLSSVRKAILPAIAAVGGMAVPALVYTLFNHADPQAMKGWAIPTATDIAFALGIIALLGKRVPVSLKMFLMALAIIDDLGAIIIIALFYTQELSSLSLLVAGASLIALVTLNIFGVSKKAAYFLIGAVLWVSVLKSGVHATLAGVALAFTIPLKAKDENGAYISPLKEIEHNLHFWVAFLILPLFAFVNSGVHLSGISIKEMLGSVSIGIAMGLFLGKQLGVFGFSWMAVKLGLAKLPDDASWKDFYGVSVLTGIGFTMSLFISSLAFPTAAEIQTANKFAILAGSLLSGVAGYIILKFTSPGLDQ